jgi:iron(III) transport system ATP-binding protein
VAELVIEGVTKSLGSRDVLTGVDLTVAAGTLTVILGASGSGKTTLLRLVMGFLELDRGRVLVGGTMVAEGGRIHMAAEKRAIGYVAQEGALFPHLSVADNVGFGLSRRERKARQRVEELLSLVGLSGEFAGRSPHELSGGEQRRVALARALAPRPRLVLLDEPFSGLDPGLRADTRRAVLDALVAEGATAVLVTHDQTEALSAGQQVAVLRDGRLVQTDRPSDLYAAPGDPEVARFVGDAVVLEGRVKSRTVTCALGSLSLARGCPEGPALVVVRPEQIALGTACDGVHGDGVPGIVTSSTFFGAQTTLECTLASEAAPIVTATSFSHAAPRVGAQVDVAVTGPVLAYPVAPPTPGTPSDEPNDAGAPEG